MGKWEGTQVGQVTSSDQRYIPDHMASSSVHKVRRRRRKRETFGAMEFVFPSHH